MDINIVDKSSWEKTIEVAILTEDLKSDFDKAYKEYKKKIQLEGFRRGKVPIDLIKKIFGKDIEAEIAEKKIPDILQEIGDKNDYKPISPAKIEEFSYDSENGLKFTALLEVVPNIELENYKGFELEKSIYQVADEDVNEALENMQDQHSEMIAGADITEYGSFVVANFQKLDDAGVAIIGEKFENRMVQLKKEENAEAQDNMADQLVGMKVGENRRVNISYKVSDTETKVDKYDVTVNEIKEKKLPELDDEFAKDVGDYENLDELKSKLKDNLELRFQQEYDHLLHESIINEVVKANAFEVPNPMIENYLNVLIENYKKNSKETIDEDKLKENFRSESIRRIKWSMAKDKMYKLENIEVTDSELEEHIEKLISNNDKNTVQIRKFYRNDEKKEDLRDELTEKKLFQFLIENANVKEKKVSRDDLNKESKIIT